MAPAKPNRPPGSSRLTQAATSCAKASCRAAGWVAVGPGKSGSKKAASSLSSSPSVLMRGKSSAPPVCRVNSSTSASRARLVGRKMVMSLSENGPSIGQSGTSVPASSFSASTFRKGACGAMVKKLGMAHPPASRASVSTMAAASPTCNQSASSRTPFSRPTSIAS